MSLFVLPNGKVKENKAIVVVDFPLLLSSFVVLFLRGSSLLPLLPVWCLLPRSFSFEGTFLLCF